MIISCVYFCFGVKSVLLETQRAVQCDSKVVRVWILVKLHTIPCNIKYALGISVPWMKGILLSISHIITPIFKRSLRVTKLPDLVKNATVVPVPMKHPPDYLEHDIRPISLTPILAEVFEAIVLQLFESLHDSRPMLSAGSSSGVELFQVFTGTRLWQDGADKQVFHCLFIHTFARCLSILVESPFLHKGFATSSPCPEAI